MKGRSKSKKLLVLNSRDIHVGWIVGSAIFMLVCLLATFAIAYRHDAYSAKLGLGDLMTTDVWFRVFLGLLVYAFIAGIIGKSGDNKGQTSRMTAETPVTREMAPAFGKKAPATEQPERVIINEAKLRDVFDSPFMHEWVSDGKNYLDHVIEDLQFVRDNYVKGSKQDEAHFASKHVIEIATILHTVKGVSPVDVAQMPYKTLNEVNYLAFGEISEEYHDELYGHLESRGDLQTFINAQPTLAYNKLKRDGSIVVEQLCKTTIIRHQIHHPENTNNPRFTLAELKQSIELMRQYLIANPSV